MKISFIETGTFKLDGGAMFGVVPKTMWAKLNPPDDNNLCTWAMRCLLIETADRKILVDTGIGEKQDAKFHSHFAPEGLDSLLQNIENQGLTAEDITDVFLTHLHFDHCGGAISKVKTNDAALKTQNSQLKTANTEGGYFPTFPNATYWSNARHWSWANNPNPREQASFLKENFALLDTWGKLQFIPEPTDNTEGVEWLPNIYIHFAEGHTEAMMMLRIVTAEKTYFYPADLLPSSWHVNLPYVMAYDVRPLETLKEKAWVLNRAATEGWHLLFEHDPNTAMATVERLETGRIVVKERF
jgi:glyoxylase-like metal-dependent hydrolase (beta-lactamase superfamily II)